MSYSNPLYDKDFLYELSHEKEREVYARITALTQDEKPIEYIEGKVTAGSVNIDGASTVRRSCSLTLVAKDVNINDFYWGLNTKFKLEVGLKNKYNSKYPDIIWFKQGLFVLTSFSTSQSLSNYTINVSGKDKMCLLNGEISGKLPHTTDFGIEEEIDAEGHIIYNSIPIKTIIREAVQNFGNELAKNIIINDIEDAGVEMLEYRGDTTLYLLRDITSDVFINMVINANQVCYRNGTERTTISKLNENEYDNLVNLEGNNNPTMITLRQAEDAIKYYVAKIEYGNVPGYRLTDLTYAGDLIANVGETLTSVLDKIVNMLGNYEYFYDIDGRFIFQAKKNYVNLPSDIFEQSDDKTEANDAINRNVPIFNFVGSNLITSFQNTPNLLNLKNDYSVWGTKKTTSGSEIPIHMRYAIDNKPIYYKSFSGNIYTTNPNLIEELKQARLEEVTKEIQNQIASFEIQYPASLYGLTKPVKQEDGSWSAGWWDLRDWYNYYYFLTQSYPNRTLKWYTNSKYDGCVKAQTLPNLKYAAWDLWVWLYVVKSINTIDASEINRHNNKGPSSEIYSISTGYESFLDENGNIVLTQLEETKELGLPYSKSPDTFTYLEAMENSESIYFIYNPNLPTGNAFMEIITNRIEQEMEEFLASGVLQLVDWREIIYQMAIDYRRHYHEDDFLVELNDNNILYNQPLYEGGRTGYEQYYVDMEGFWRYIFNPEIQYDIVYSSTPIENEYYYHYENDKLIDDGILTTFKEGITYYTRSTEYYYPPREGYLPDEEESLTIEEKQYYWSRAVYEDPESLLFWIDFLDSDLFKFSVQYVGIRSEAVNDKDVSAIYYRETPTVIFKSPNEAEYEHKTGYTYVNLQTYMENLFTISKTRKSAWDKIAELLYKHSYCIESVNIQAIPVYYLEPNTRVFIRDDKNGINGEYVVSKITIPLTYNGTMSLTATKAVESIV